MLSLTPRPTVSVVQVLSASFSRLSSSGSKAGALEALLQEDGRPDTIKSLPTFPQPTNAAAHDHDDSPSYYRSPRLDDDDDDDAPKERRASPEELHVEEDDDEEEQEEEEEEVEPQLLVRQATGGSRRIVMLGTDEGTIARMLRGDGMVMLDTDEGSVAQALRDAEPSQHRPPAPSPHYSTLDSLPLQNSPVFVPAPLLASLPATAMEGLAAPLSKPPQVRPRRSPPARLCSPSASEEHVASLLLCLSASRCAAWCLTGRRPGGCWWWPKPSLVGAAHRHVTATRRWSLDRPPLPSTNTTARLRALPHALHVPAHPCPFQPRQHRHLPARGARRTRGSAAPPLCPSEDQKARARGAHGHRDGAARGAVPSLHASAINPLPSPRQPLLLPATPGRGRSFGAFVSPHPIPPSQGAASAARHPVPLRPSSTTALVLRRQR